MGLLSRGLKFKLPDVFPFGQAELLQQIHMFYDLTFYLHRVSEAWIHLSFIPSMVLMFSGVMMPEIALLQLQFSPCTGRYHIRNKYTSWH